MTNLEASYNEILAFFNATVEWLLINSAGRSFSLKSDEFELTIEREKILFGFLDDGGFQVWRVAGYKFEKGKITLKLTRNFSREFEKISLVPRTRAGELAGVAELARAEKAEQLAKLIVESEPRAKLMRVALNKETGRFAQIVFENMEGRQIAVIADVSDALTPEILLTSAILWLEKLKRRRKNPVDVIWILAEKKIAKSLQRLHALLAEDWKRKIILREISRPDAKKQSAGLKEISSLKIAALWREKAKEIQIAAKLTPSEISAKIMALAPDEIDVLFTKHGETLRFSGLPFARVRTVFSEEKAWFGIDVNRRILNENTFDDFLELIENLRTYRSFDAPNKQHLFYRAAPEAWLEAVLRKNIRLIDANLILSPLHIQFRAEKDRIDLLALRRDGRLVIIELKVSSDREMIFQCADYWQKIERQRRAGHIEKAKIFGDLKIKDEPPLVYLAAPMLSFHKDFAFLAKTISPEIEIYRFDLNETWRASLKVLRRERV